MRHSLYLKRGDEWLTAPWNDGAGGKFEPLREADALWFPLVLAECGLTDLDSGTFLLGDLEDDPDKDDALISLQTLSEAKKKPGKRVQVDGGSDGKLEVTGFPQAWLDWLAKPGAVPLAVAKVGGRLVLAWLNDGGRDAWKKECVVRDAEHKAQKKASEAAKLAAQRRNELQQKRDDGSYFINPYSFVPLPPSVTRTRPGGHEALGADSVSGWFDWNLTCKTELLLPHEEASAIQNEVLDYPGSSLRGALRSLHETMSGGCMRVVDGSFLPVHREPMNAYKSSTDRLAVVTQIDPVTHAVTEVKLADEVQWVDHKALTAKLRGGLYSGRRLTVDAVGSSVHGRSEITDPTAISPPSASSPEWVMHITSKGARRPDHPYFVAVGRLSGPTKQIDESTWTAYVDACSGGADLVGVAHPPDTATYTPNGDGWPCDPVDSHGTPIGKRRRADGWLGIGDTVWVTGKGELKMAAIWRTHGEHSVEERMATDLLPCSDPESLCPSCSVFGSIRAERSAEHEQAAYRTHIQVGWAKSVSPQDGSTPERVTSTAKTLPPLRSPQPSSGGFYLEAPGGRFRSADKNENHVQRSHWYDQPNESGELRRVRGRKFYWHGQSKGGRQTPWTHDQTQNGSAHALPAGTVLSARITFDNLSPEQLGWLLAAAEPKRLFGSKCVVHLGGGKPLGYGTAEPRIENLHLETATQRYANDAVAAPEQRADDAVRLVRGLVEERQLTEVHAALKHLLSPDAVHADRINYPTSKPFSTRGSKEFDEAFRWFGTHSGGRKGHLVPLPDAADPDQYLSIAVEDQEGKR